MTARRPRRRRAARPTLGAEAALAARARVRAGPRAARPCPAVPRGACSASTAPASPQSPRRWPQPAATATGSRRRSARATSRSTSTSSSHRVRTSAPTSLSARSWSRSSDYLFAEDEQSVEEIVLELCRAQELTLATAESCTGGLVAARLTSVPGSSDVFLGAVVAYANGVKEAELGVSEELLQTHGAVSAETAAAMAAGVRRAARSGRRHRRDGHRGARRRLGGETGRARVHARRDSGRRAAGSSSATPPTGNRSAAVRPWPACTSRDECCHGLVTHTYDFARYRRSR